MTTTIRDTVTETMRRDRQMSAYTSYATPVIEALEQREHGIADALLSLATKAGMDETEARQAFSEAGLTLRPVAAAPAAGSGRVSGTQSDELASIRHDAASLVERIDRVLG